jgi:hypothetical protein
LAPRLLEDDALGGEAAVDRGARRARVAVGAETVGAERVDRDEQQVRAVGGAPRIEEGEGAEA